MRIGTLAVAGMLLGTQVAQAGGDALIVGNSRYGAVQSFFGSARVVAAADSLLDAGLDVVEITDANGPQIDAAFARFVDGIDESAEPLIIVLAGAFMHGAGGTYLMPVNERREMSDAQVMTKGFPLDAALAILAQAPGRAFLVLGESENETDAGRFLEEGIGELDIPQGVTVIRGPASDVAAFAARDMARVGISLTKIAEPYELDIQGYIPQRQVILRQRDVVEAEGDAAPEPVDTLSPFAQREADQTAWRLAQQADSAEGYRTYLEGFPEGQNAAAARQRLKAIQDEPFYSERRAEEALELTRDARREIQRDLSLLGFNTRGIDGIFGRGTRAAILAWQRSVGDRPSAYLNAAQIQRLDEAAKARAEQLEEEARERAEQLARRDRALWAEVSRRPTEQNLRQYLSEFPEGLYSDDARRRLSRIEEQRAAQAASQDRDLWQQARGEDTIAAYRLYLERQPRGAFADEAAARIAELNKDADRKKIVARAKAEEKALGLNAVTRRLIEARLAQVGLKPGETDGKFDKKTRRAIREYQRTRGLQVTGYIDEKTAVRLLADGILRR